MGGGLLSPGSTTYHSATQIINCAEQNYAIVRRSAVYIYSSNIKINLQLLLELISKI